MEKTDMTSRTLAELKALAQKKKIALPAGAKKADIIALLKAGAAGAASARKPAPEKNSVSRGKVASKRAPAPERTPAGKPAEKPAQKHDWKLPAGAEEPLMAQSQVSESKFYTGPAQQRQPGPYEYLPNEYGEDKIALMTRDPYMAYSYWETTPARIEREKAWFGWDSKLCVRMYDVTGVRDFNGTNAVGYFDQEVYERTGNWYFDLGRPTHTFCADIGLLAPGGRFLTLARSNFITMPRDGVSEVLDEEWMLLDEEFWKLYGFPSGLSSPQSQEMVKRRRLLEITSPGTFSRERAAKAKRK